MYAFHICVPHVQEYVVATPFLFRLMPSLVEGGDHCMTMPTGGLISCAVGKELLSVYCLFTSLMLVLASPCGLREREREKFQRQVASSAYPSLAAARKRLENFSQRVSQVASWSLCLKCLRHLSPDLGRRRRVAIY
jgi:hypothetical protein